MKTPPKKPAIKKTAVKKAAVKKTLDRILSKSGAASRTEARQWIAKGRVKVDGRVVTSPDEWVEPERQRVTLDGKPLRAPDRLYLLFYKPKGYLTTQKDPEGRPTIYDLLRDLPARVTYAGRLDLDTSGLLILTNDHEFSDYISSPESHVPKTYLVKAAPLLTDGQLDRLRQGIELSDGPTRPARVERLRDGPRHTFFEITITEGRNRQVRRMVEALEGRVLKLVRTRIGPIEIAGLEIGKYRELEPREIEALKRATVPPSAAR